jgi:hypothetical protein
MKIYYALSIVAALAVSTTVGDSFVAAAGTPAASTVEAVSVQSAALERLMAESNSSNTTWRRPL